MELLVSLFVVVLMCALAHAARRYLKARRLRERLKAGRGKGFEEAAEAYHSKDW